MNAETNGWVKYHGKGKCSYCEAPAIWFGKLPVGNQLDYACKNHAQEYTVVSFECAHDYMEAQNYGQERGNVECRKCGAFWKRVLS